MAQLAFVRTAAAAAIAFSGIAFSSAAHAAIVSYDFESQIDTNATRGSTRALDRAGIPTSGALTGSFSYDSEAGFSVGSVSYLNSWMGELSLTVNEVNVDADLVTLVASARTDQMDIGTIDDGIWVNLYLPGQSIDRGSLPTSLSLQEGAQLTVGVGVWNSVTADLTSLSASTGTAVPELDPASGSASLALLLGGIAAMSPLRRRRKQAESAA